MSPVCASFFKKLMRGFFGIIYVVFFKKMLNKLSNCQDFQKTLIIIVVFKFFNLRHDKLENN